MDRSVDQWGLDADERQTCLALVSVLSRLPQALSAQLQRDAGLNHFEFQVLIGLFNAPDRTLRMSVLAMHAEGSLARLSQVVRRLERRRWVRRTPDPIDGRYTLAILTDDGAAKVEQATPGHIQTLRDLVLDPLTRTQARQLSAICHRIMQAVAPDDACVDAGPRSVAGAHHRAEPQRGTTSV